MPPAGLNLNIRGVDMRRILLLLLAASTASAQERRAELLRQGLPRDVQREATSLYNSATRQVNGRLDILEDEELTGDVAVRNGPVVIAGRIRGSLLAINSDVILRPTARIDRDLLVVGGEVEGRNDAYIGGEIRIYRQSLRYAEQAGGQGIVADRDTIPGDDGWWRRMERRRPRSWTRLQVASAGAYNRVEGLPIKLGPQIQQGFPWGSMRLDAYAVMRTGSSFSSNDSTDVGHNARLEMRIGRRSGIGFGGRLFNIVDNVEPWQLGDLETSLASFLFRRDYRDYYQRHGANAYATVYATRDIGLTASFGEERWVDRSLNNPFTLFRGGADWRPNPMLDEGHLHIANGTLSVDTRTDEDRPWSGWYIVADYERGTGTLTSLGATSLPRTTPAGAVTYQRGFLDLRRFNRLSPDAQINMRVMVGGWLDGDPLPLQRRFSVEGAGMMPGYDFRSPAISPDVGTCSTGLVPAGRPAECERMALMQVEYRGGLGFNLSSFGDDDFDGPHMGDDFRAEGTWVLFADAGRGWMVGQSTGDDLTYARDELPPLSTFRSDIGLGLDFGWFGLYVAKALSNSKEPANVFVRLRHRF